MATLTIAGDRHTVVTTGWTNPSNAYSTSGNNVYATAAPAKNATIDGDFGFPSANVPTGATVTAARIVVEWGMTASVTGGTLGIQGRNNGVADSAAEVTKTSTTEAQDTFTFGAVPSTTDANTAGRLVGRIRCSKGNTNTAMTGNLDFVRLEVDYVYTIAVGGGSTPGGVLVKKGQKVLAAAFTPSGGLTNTQGGGGADITATQLGSGLYDTSNVTAWTHASVTASANKLLVLFYDVRGSDLTGLPDLTGGTLAVTWEHVDHSFLTGMYVGMAVAKSGAGGSGTVVMDVSAVQGATPTGASMQIFELGNVNLSGTNAVDALQQFKSGATNGVSSRSLVFDAAISTNNATLVGTAMRAAEDVTPDTGNSFTELADGNFLSPSTSAEVQFRASGFTGTSVTATWTTAVQAHQVGIEVKKAAGGGGVTQQKSFTAGITPAAVIAKQPQKPFAGAMTPAGALVKQTIRTFTGSIASAGALAKQLQRRFTAGITPAGALTNIRLRTVALAGSLTPAGTVVKQTAKSLAAPLAPTGALAKQVQRRFTASIASSGVVAATKVALKSVSGSIASSGALLKQIGKSLSGANTPAGSLTRQPQKKLAGANTPAGTLAVTKLLVRTFSGSIATAGALIRVPGKALAGTITSAGSLLRQPQIVRSGSVATAGTLQRSLSRRFTAMIGSSGVVTVLAVKTKAFAGSIASAGTLVLQTRKTFAALIASAGTLTKLTIRRFTGSITSAGTLAVSRVRVLALSGALGPSGALVKRIQTTYAGSIATAGALTRQVRKTLTATIASTGTLTTLRSVARSFAGTIAPTGSLRRSALKALAGALAPAGSLIRDSFKRFASAIGLTGTLTVDRQGVEQGMQAVRKALLELLSDAAPTLAVDDSGAEPFRFEPDTLYLWEDIDRASARSRGRTDFGFMAAVTLDDRGEQAKQLSDRTVSDALDAVATAMLLTLRDNVQSVEWTYLRAAYDPDYTTTFGARGFALRISGYRIE